MLRRETGHLVRPDALDGARVHLTGLVWGLKSTFIAYAERMNARIYIGDGAGRTSSGEFLFALEREDGFDQLHLTGTLMFNGSVRATHTQMRGTEQPHTVEQM